MRVELRKAHFLKICVLNPLYFLCYLRLLYQLVHIQIPEVQLD